MLPSFTSTKVSGLATLASVAGFLAVAGTAAAHHSFAVHFEGERTVTIEGRVTEFRFRNPHGTIVIDATTEGGDPQLWQVETNSPNILRRRGWSEDSLAVGDRVAITGFPARDGSNSMRVYRVEFADGRELVGQRPAAGIER